MLLEMVFDRVFNVVHKNFQRHKSIRVQIKLCFKYLQRKKNIKNATYLENMFIEYKLIR